VGPHRRRFLGLTAARRCAEKDRKNNGERRSSRALPVRLGGGARRPAPDRCFLDHEQASLGSAAPRPGVAGRAAPLIKQAMGAIADRPSRVVRRATELLGDPRGKRVLMVGVAYKPGVQDVRESPSLEILEALQRAGCRD
ncbi:hypothetical protein B4Q13_19695, partial [Lacticaseibacillus rhamnosus]